MSKMLKDIPDIESVLLEVLKIVNSGNLEIHEAKLGDVYINNTTLYAPGYDAKIAYIEIGNVKITLTKTSREDHWRDGIEISLNGESVNLNTQNQSWENLLIKIVNNFKSKY